MNKKNNQLKIAIIGLGYVGLPLALEFAKKRTVIAFDIEKKRIKQLKAGFDKNFETSKKDIGKIKKIRFTHNEEDLKLANCFIITVPTPIKKNKKPELKPILSASKTVGKCIKKEDLIIYESTVYPGCIEEKCVPVLERYSKLKYNKDFFCGYSPERINPGDKKHNITNIKKITSGSTTEVTELVDRLYRSIIKAGTHKAPSIKVAEAAKVIENTQRDLNIALINELSILFKRLNIDTKDVLDAAESKWNFLKFTPGLVGGHCIGVDPYYLTHKAKMIGYTPKIILSGRNINDKMGFYVASQLKKKLKQKNINIKGAKILIMGITFKENCADIRNSGVKVVFDELKKFKCKVDLKDPWVDNNEIKKIYKIYPISKTKKNNYDAVIIAVAHKKFKSIGIKSIHEICKKKHVIYDLKYLFPKDKVDLRL
ncbi:Vi polysaccharide biosynthesis UDP-N-acetylglucosamine C-6 dehydrogenase TviB [Candidatus Pelagibacter sp.]|nr:Vi polysaccharide biosynthesis UDP-N-acetylglucosamine C-6 dehydrogenase TviB [Candidatus Pelagibacter sp.]